MEVLVDIGNTAIKFAISDNKNLIPFLIIPSQNILTEKYLFDKLEMGIIAIGKKLKDIRLLCLSSVRPMWDNLFRQLAQDMQWAFYQVKTNLTVPESFLAVPNPRNVGADILVGAYAAVQNYQKDNCIIVNMGTATTITLVKQKQLIGTIIMPGLETSAIALFNSAQLLQEFEYTLETDKYIGQNTKEAINLGLVNGHGYAVKSLVEHIQQQIPGLTVILTGGNSKYFQTFFPTYCSDETLIFKGLLALLIDNKVIK
ncbi:type III pantothenate kinase [Spiroplasma chrysopicola]|uniref:Type III pantothenate kinase n=1 Tax=Spiroplasma chrysopicola DF-1 TaxID=1276227 RepID=R4UBB3_9MOLU|nr:type III pantothenate kinase [Spiroplasma chrysopicola]AGM25169.1 putative transcriptional regulator [Spiroplasma chrysopicola DF-1]